MKTFDLGVREVEVLEQALLAGCAVYPGTQRPHVKSRRFERFEQGEVVFSDPNFHRRELTVMSSRNATSAEFGQVIAAMESGRVDTTPWITHRLPYADVPTGFAKTVGEGALRKAVIHLDD